MRVVFGVSIAVAFAVYSCGHGVNLRPVDYPRVTCTSGENITYDGHPVALWKSGTRWIIEEQNGNRISTPGTCVRDEL
jgi:hypothetical protein